MGTRDSTGTLHVVLACDNRGFRRDLLAAELRNYGLFVTPVATADEARHYIAIHGYPGLLVIDETTAKRYRNDGWRTANDLVQKEHAAVVLADQAHIDFPDVVWVRPRGTTAEVATKILFAFESMTGAVAA